MRRLAGSSSTRKNAHGSGKKIWNVIIHRQCIYQNTAQGDDMKGDIDKEPFRNDTGLTPVKHSSTVILS